MQYKEFIGVRVGGIACAVPNNKVMTDSYSEFFGYEKVERFKEATGIESRYITDGNQTASDLCYAAARSLMNHKSLTGDDIDALIFITQSPDYRTPATAFLLHKRLAIKKDCIVFDINLGCVACVEGLYTMAALVESGTIRRGLLLIGDSNTQNREKKDTSETMMFGDAGSAILVESGEGCIRGMIRSDGEGMDSLIVPIPGYRFPYVYPDEKSSFKMNGDDIFLFSISRVPKLFKEFYSQFNCSNDDYDYYVLHQPNLMIIKQIIKKLKLDPQKVPISITEYGNTNGSAIPVGIVYLSEMEKNRNIRVICSGFGNGLSWGVIDFNILTEDVLPMIYTSDYYAEGKSVL